MSYNKIEDLSPIPQPKLLRVNMDNNMICNCDDFGGHANLVHLSLNKNKLEKVNGLKKFAKLQTLGLAKN